MIFTNNSTILYAQVSQFGKHDLVESAHEKVNPSLPLFASSNLALPKLTVSNDVMAEFFRYISNSIFFEISFTFTTNVCDVVQNYLAAFGNQKPATRIKFACTGEEEQHDFPLSRYARMHKLITGTQMMNITSKGINLMVLIFISQCIPGRRRMSFYLIWVLLKD
jgi:hypothetical protein